MAAIRKITLEVPAQLLEQAQVATGENITETVRRGLRLVAAGRVYEELRALRGRVRFARTARQLKHDRA